MTALPCPHCSASLATSDLLDAATGWFPRSSVVKLRCPTCAVEVWAQLTNGQLAIGAPVGDVRQFQPSASAPEPDLQVRPDTRERWLDCWFAGRYRRFPAMG
jgi:hypothetical protein